MKRTIASLSCAALLCISLAGCSGEGDDLESQAEARQRTPPPQGAKPAGAGKVGLKSTDAGAGDGAAATEEKKPAAEGDGG